MARIKSSLSAKVFLVLALLLTLCCLCICGVVVITLPRSYSIVATDRVSGEITQLVDTLAETNFADADAVIEDFCSANRASVMLNAGFYSRVYGSVGEGGGEVLTSSVSVRFADSYGEALLTVTAPISAGRELTAAFLELLPWLLALILLISAAGALLCSRALVKPVLELSRISDRMAGLDMSWEYGLDRTDELGTLARSLKSMSQRLDAALHSLEDANRHLTADMEHITALSKQRRDFFAAASHELKTPITILKGQVESMLLGIGRYKDTRAVLPETLREVEHMERLVGEILSVTRLEMDGLAGRSEPVSLCDTLRSVVDALRPLAEEKGIALTLDASRDVTVTGSAALMERALHNVVGNAIRYSPAGASVSAVLTGRLLSVTNTGVTIPEEDLADIFTPFRRVDKSRSRSGGGSGLGLYIVHTILDLHGLNYGLENGDDAVIFWMDGWK